MLSKKHVEDRCLAYSGHKACRYLLYDRITGTYLCVKKVDAFKEDIDKRVEKHIERAKANNQDLITLGRGIADNCDGYLYLKNKQQGYDVPGSV
jgi:hypothetical protein